MQKSREKKLNCIGISTEQSPESIARKKLANEHIFRKLDDFDFEKLSNGIQHTNRFEWKMISSTILEI